MKLGSLAMLVMQENTGSPPALKATVDRVSGRPPDVRPAGIRVRPATGSGPREGTRSARVANGHRSGWLDRAARCHVALLARLAMGMIRCSIHGLGDVSVCCEHIDSARSAGRFEQVCIVRFPCLDRWYARTEQGDPLAAVAEAARPWKGQASSA